MKILVLHEKYGDTYLDTSIDGDARYPAKTFLAVIQFRIDNSYYEDDRLVEALGIVGTKDEKSAIAFMRKSAAYEYEGWDVEDVQTWKGL